METKNNLEIYDAGDLTAANKKKLLKLGYKKVSGKDFSQFYHPTHYRAMTTREFIDRKKLKIKHVTWFFDQNYEILSPEAIAFHQD